MTRYGGQNVIDAVIQTLAITKLYQFFSDICDQLNDIWGAKQGWRCAHNNSPHAKPIYNKPHSSQPVRCLGNSRAIMVRQRDNFWQ